MAIVQTRKPTKARQVTEDPRERGIPRHGNDGRPKIYDPETGKGTYYSRTTNYIDVLEDKTQLAAWKTRMVLEGISGKPTLLDEYRALEDPLGKDKRQADAIVAKALDVADIQEKAEWGTILHGVTEAIDRGETPPPIPPEYEADIAAYKECIKDIEFVQIETFGVLDDLKVGGTFDRLGIVRGDLADMLNVPDGSILVMDLKTGRIDYGIGKIAMQLAAYQKMEAYDPKTFTRTRYKGVRDDVALIIHMPAGQGTCSLVPVDIAKGAEGLSIVKPVRAWRNYWNRVANKPKPIRVIE